MRRVKAGREIFVRAHMTNENAGKFIRCISDCIVVAKNAAKSDGDGRRIKQPLELTYGNKIRNFPGYPTPGQYPILYRLCKRDQQSMVARKLSDSLYKFHDETRNYADTVISSVTGLYSRFVPGNRRV